MSIVKERAWQLIKGFVGINITFILSGILYEKIAKNSYYNFETNNYDLFRSSVGYSLVLRFVTWILSQIYSYMTLKKQEKVEIADKNKIVCGVIIFVSSISFMEAMYLVSYPFIMMAKSSNILQVVLVGVFCSRVKDKKTRLGKQKLITSLVVTIGIILFKVFDPETQFSLEGSLSGEMMGLMFLLVNMLADCFLPDFQAEIKEKFKPHPVQMQTQISKWSFLICLVYANFSGDLSYTLDFMITHPMFSLELLVLSVLSFLGQTFVYKIIKKFQQHIVPLIVGTRKTFTVALSLIYFDHRTSFGQVFGILVVFSATIWEFMATLHKKEEKQAVKQEGMKESENNIEEKQQNKMKIQTRSTIIQIEPTPPKFGFKDDNANSIQESNIQIIKQGFMIEEAYQKDEQEENFEKIGKQECLVEQKDTDTSN